MAQGGLMTRRSTRPQEKTAVASRPSPRLPKRVVPQPRTAALMTPWSWVALLLVALVSGLVFSNSAPDAAVHDDKFFVPSQFGLDSRSVVRMFSIDTWAITGSSE